MFCKPVKRGGQLLPAFSASNLVHLAGELLFVTFP